MDQNDTCMDVDANASIVTDAVSHDNDTGVSVNITDTSVRDPNGANNIAVEVRSQPNAVDVNIPLESNVVNGDSYASRAARTDGSAFGFRQMPRPSTPCVCRNARDLHCLRLRVLRRRDQFLLPYLPPILVLLIFSVFSVK